MTARPVVAGVLQMVSELTLAASQARTGQLRRIQWHTGQGCRYVHMTRGSFGRDTVWYVCC
jgi:1,4-dihydroxy-2-naphthoyl-CoA synthase